MNLYFQNTKHNKHLSTLKLAFIKQQEKRVMNQIAFALAPSSKSFSFYKKEQKTLKTNEFMNQQTLLSLTMQTQKHLTSTNISAVSTEPDLELARIKTLGKITSTVYQSSENSDSNRDSTEDKPEVENQPLQIKLAEPHPHRLRATGRRKSAVASVMIKPILPTDKNPTEIFLINLKPSELYFQENPYLLENMLAPLNFLKLRNKLQMMIFVKGGGLVSQASAIKLALSRVLCLLNVDYRRSLKLKGYLRRDARVKERKKYGLKKARKSPQFSKR